MIKLRTLICILTILSYVGFQNSSAQSTAVDTKEYTTQEVIDELLKAKSDNKIKEGLEFLSKELDKRADKPGEFSSLYTTVWTEAQVKSGRLDQDWAAQLYDQLFISAYTHRYYGKMDDVIGNLLVNLGAAGRHGRKTEILEWWAQGKEESGKILEITRYRDQGPVMEFLPDVRKRDIPLTLLFARTEPQEGESANSVDIEQKNAQIFSIYADHLADAGRWRQSMEWIFQIRRWASLENGSPRWQLIQPWFGSVSSIANWLQWHGYLEEALLQVDEGLAAPMQNSYHGRYNITFSLQRLVLLMELGRAPDDLVEQAIALAKKAEENQHLNAWSHRAAKLIVAKALIHTGKDAEGLALLDELAAVGFTPARNTRLEYWIKHKMLEKVEAELLSLLKDSRETGNKFSEHWLYEKYADFLELSGRLQEALTIRRETIRLCRSFDYFTKLPTQLAKLAILLERMGDMAGSKAAADEARKLLAQGKISERHKKQAEGFLTKRNPGNKAVEQESKKTPLVDFQPERSIVIPIADAAWTSLLTLANPSDKVEEGTLSCKGMAMSFTREGENQDIVVRPVTDKKQGDPTLRLRLEPSAYQLVKITADPTFTKTGELSLIWTSWRGETLVEANVQIEAPEKGVSSSVIQAGNYKANPFYGVPVHLHYVTKDKATKSLPLRFITSQKARVEVYALDGTPLSVDSQGNGSLRDKGDELFGGSDNEGNLLLSLTDHAASFMILIYPNGNLPPDGLSLDVEAYEKEAWSLYSQNRLKP